MSLSRQEESTMAEHAEERRGRIRRKISQSEYSHVSEKLIERDFFPQLAQLRSELSDSISRDRVNVEVVDLSAETLDTFKERYESLENSKFHRTLEKSNDSYRKISRNPLMFNHAGIEDSTRSMRSRKGINYSNTRIPLDWGAQNEESAADPHSRRRANMSAPIERNNT